MTNAAKAPALETLADYAAGIELASVPIDIGERIRTCLIDTLWAALHVHHDSRAQAALRAAPADVAARGANILGTRRRVPAPEAAFVGALASAATDRSDTHLPTATHPGIIVIPAVLAALEERGGSGADLARGILIGYEIMGRIARAIVVPGFTAIYRPTPIAGPIAAAMAVAAALRLDSRAIAVAGSLATHTAVAFNEWARAGTSEHVVHAGFAARNAVTCAYLAAEGLDAAMTALDGQSGLLAGYNALPRAGELTRELGCYFEMSDIAFKPAPACFFAQTPAQVAVSLARHVNVAAIEKIEIGVTETALNHPGCAASAGITTTQAAVMSIPFAVASSICAKRIDPGSWNRPTDAAVAELASRCKVHADPLFTAAYPARSGTNLTVHLRDGSVLHADQQDFRSMTHDEVVARYRADADPLLGAARVTRVLELVAKLDDLTDVSTLMQACGLDQPSA
jgi:2-methylcitrate dehydratase PrpD